MSLSKKYKKSKDKKWLLRFKTSHPEGDHYSGVVTDIKRTFIVLRELRELEFDGILVLPKKVLKGCRDSKYEACHNRILRHSGSINKAKSYDWNPLIDINTLYDVVQKIRRNNIWPSVEILFEIDGKLETDFYIGPIIKIERYGFWICPYDGAGKWEEEYFIEFKEIFKIEFDDQYSSTFNNYMRSLYNLI